MKRVWFIWLLVVNAYSLYAQHSKFIRLSEFKKNPRIDSLFNTIIDSNKHLSHYVSFSILNLETHYVFSIIELKNSRTGIFYPFAQSHIHVKTYGYFPFRGHIIFISGDKDPYGLLKKTDFRKSFRFIIYNAEDADPDLTLYVHAFKYERGIFSEELIPELESISK